MFGRSRRKDDVFLLLSSVRRSLTRRHRNVCVSSLIAIRTPSAVVVYVHGSVLIGRRNKNRPSCAFSRRRGHRPEGHYSRRRPEATLRRWHHPRDRVDGTRSPTPLFGRCRSPSRRTPACATSVEFDNHNCQTASVQLPRRPWRRSCRRTHPGLRARSTCPARRATALRRPTGR
jgi:hypothetical protein